MRVLKHETESEKSKNLGQPEDDFNTEEVKQYKTQAAFLEDLDTVFRKDYGVQLSEQDLKEAGRNVEILLANFL